MDEFDMENTTEESQMTENSAIDEETFGIEKKKKLKLPKFHAGWTMLIGILIYTLVSNRFPNVGQTLWFNIIIRIVIALPVMAMAVLRQEKCFLPIRICMIAAGLSWFVPLFASGYHICLMVDMVIAWLGILSFGASYLSIFDGRKKIPLRDEFMVVMGIHFILFFKDIKIYNFTNSDMAFWMPALIGALAFGGIGALVVFTGKIEQKGKGEIFATLFIVVFAAFALIWSSAQHLNYALDTSEPQEVSEEIVHKKIDRNGDTTDYYLTVKLNGEDFKINVSSQAYKSYEIGDTLTFYYFEGAFGEPFYMY